MQNQTKKQLKKTILENREDFIKAFIELVNEDDDFSAKFSEATLDLALNDKKFARLLMLAKELIYNKYANTDDRNFVCGNTVIDIMKSNWDEKGDTTYGYLSDNGEEVMEALESIATKYPTIMFAVICKLVDNNISVFSFDNMKKFLDKFHEYRDSQKK